MKRSYVIIGVSIILSVTGFGFLLADSDDGTVDQCLTAWNNRKDNPSGIGSIKNPYDSDRYLICKGENMEIVVKQAFMDLKLTKIDKQIESDLNTIYGMKDKTVAEVGEILSGWLDDGSKDSKYPKKYLEACASVFPASCAFLQSKKSTCTTDNISGDILANLRKSKCFLLAEKKLKAYKEVGWLVFGKVLVDKYTEDKHKFVTKINDKYEKLLNKIIILVGQYATIKDKWPSKTPKTQE